MQHIDSLADFSKLINNLSYREFENYVVEVLKLSEEFDDVKSPQIINKREIDIVATEKIKSSLSQNISWAIEVKKRKAPLSIAEIDILLGKWQDIKTQHPEINFLIVSPSGVSKYALQKADHYGLKIWGLKELFLQTKPETQIKYFNLPFNTQKPMIQPSSKEETLIALLKDIRPGKKEWPKYQEACLEILEQLFCPPLEHPRYELADIDRKNRRDMIFENSTQEGFWRMVRETYLGHYIVVDAKNYKDPLSKEPVIAIAHYLKPYGCGMFGILVSRKGESPSAFHAIKEQWIGNNKLIVILSDNDMIEMLEIKKANSNPEELIRGKIAKFRMSL